MQTGNVYEEAEGLLALLPPNALLRAVGVGDYYLSERASLFERLLASLAAAPYLRGHPAIERLCAFLSQQTGFDARERTAIAVWRALFGCSFDEKECYAPTAIFGQGVPADAALPSATAWRGIAPEGVLTDAEDPSFFTRLATFCGREGEKITSLATVEQAVLAQMADKAFVRVAFPHTDAFYLPHPYPAERALAALAAGETPQPRDGAVLSLQLLRTVFAASAKTGAVPLLAVAADGADTVARFLTFLLRDGLLPPTLGIALPAKAEPDEWCALAGAFAACGGQPRVRIGVQGEKAEAARFAAAAATCLSLPLCFCLSGDAVCPLEA